MNKSFLLKTKNMNIELIAELNMKCLLLAREYNGNLDMNELLKRAEMLAKFLATTHLLNAI